LLNVLPAEQKALNIESIWACLGHVVVAPMLAPAIPTARPPPHVWGGGKGVRRARPLNRRAKSPLYSRGVGLQAKLRPHSPEESEAAGRVGEGGWRTGEDFGGGRRESGWFRQEAGG
jgi:hypothetical protein